MFQKQITPKKRTGPTIRTSRRYWERIDALTAGKVPLILLTSVVILKLYSRGIIGQAPALLFRV